MQTPHDWVNITAKDYWGIDIFRILNSKRREGRMLRGRYEINWYSKGEHSSSFMLVRDFLPFWCEYRIFLFRICVNSSYHESFPFLSHSSRDFSFWRLKWKEYVFSSFVKRNADVCVSRFSELEKASNSFRFHEKISEFGTHIRWEQQMREILWYWLVRNFYLIKPYFPSSLSYSLSCLLIANTLDHRICQILEYSK